MGLSPVLKIFYHIAALFSTKREGEITEKRKDIVLGKEILYNRNTFAVRERLSAEIPGVKRNFYRRVPDL